MFILAKVIHRSSCARGNGKEAATYNTTPLAVAIGTNDTIEVTGSPKHLGRVVAWVFNARWRIAVDVSTQDIAVLALTTIVGVGRG